VTWPGGRVSPNPEGDVGATPSGEQLGERIHIVIMRSARKQRTRMKKVVDPGAIGPRDAVRLRVREVNVSRFHSRLSGAGPRQFAAFGRDPNDAFDVVA